jgi:hypothetical protein
MLRSYAAADSHFIMPPRRRNLSPVLTRFRVPRIQARERRHFWPVGDFRVSGEQAPSEWPKVLRHLVPFLIVFSLLWLGFTWAWAKYPYFKNATDIIIDTKLDVVNGGEVFQKSPQDAARVVVCGHSLVLAGFIPKYFDELSGGKTFSYNLGLPGQTGFDELETVITRGTPPTHVFLQVPWEKEFEPSLWRWLDLDRHAIKRLIPFRRAPRDLFVFLALAPRKGGISALYEFGKSAAERMVLARGHYVISANLYPDERLPDDRKHPDDTPERVRSRVVHPSGSRFERLLQLADRHHIEIYFIPRYVREGYAAVPPPINTETVEEFKPYPRFHVIGPDYFRYPNRMFCDWIHVNDDGARRYTKDLWEVTQSIFSKPDRKASATSGAGNDAL